MVALNGSGRAPAAANVEWFQDQGIAEWDAEGPHVVTVPGAVDAWEMVLRDHGRKGLDELLQPAIRFAEDGCPVHARVAWDWANEAGKLAKDDSTAAVFLPVGKPLREGEIFVQKALAETLRRIAKDGRDGFYTGPVAEDIVEYLRGKGGLHTLDDFAAQRSEYVEPIHTDYRGYRIHECPPNGVGIVTLMMLNMLAGFDVDGEDPLSTARLHRVAEVTRLAYRDRDAFVADPAQVEVPVEMLLSQDYAAEQSALIRPDRMIGNLPAPGFRPHDDTVYLTVVDGDGNACSFINSLFKSFGSGQLAPGSGVMLQNRGLGFVLEPGHPNCIAPGKRPLHTIIPAMLTRNGRAVMPFGVMGGHYQPVGQTWFLTNMLDYGLDIQEALDLPRILAFEGTVDIERGIPEVTAKGLARLGHRVERVEKPHGGGQAIWIDWQRGVLTGGSEPRKDGCALGY